MGDRESLALAEAMLALGVRRFRCGELEVEFHDSTLIQRAVAAATRPSDEEPEEAYLHGVKRDRAKDQQDSETLGLLLRSAG
jgi:hypothetical protein